MNEKNDTSPQQRRALGMDEVLITIYGFALGTDMNTIVNKMQICLVSRHFKKCFVAYLRSVQSHLKLRYGGSCDGPQEGTIVRWMKRYDIASLFGLKAWIYSNDLDTFNRDFADFDFSNLNELELTISTMNPGRYSFFDRVHNIHSLFTVAASLTHLTLSDNTRHPIESYANFLSSFPILKSLEVNFGSQNAADPDGVSRASEKALRLERLLLHGLYGDNFTLCSESLKILDLHTCFLRSIARLDCPSLEELVCQNPIIIGGISGSALAEEYGNSDRDFITSFLENVEHQVHSSDVESIASISIVPFDSIEGNNSIQVGSDCRIIIFTFSAN